MKRNLLTLVVGGVLLLIFLLLLFMFQVRLTEVAVVTRFGKPSRDAAAGAHFKWPWPLERVYKFDQRIQNYESPMETVLTSDGYNLLITVYAGWRIDDPKLFFPAFGDSVRRAEETLEGLVRNAYSAVVGEHPFSHFISTDPEALRFIEMEEQMLGRVAPEAAKYGLEVEFIGIKQLALPESVTQLVFDRMRSERQVLVSEIQFEGERQASDIRSAADLESAKLLTEAEAEATRIEGLGAQQALQSFEVFEQNPELAEFLLKLKALESFLKERSTLILDQRTPPLELLSPANGGVRAEGSAGDSSRPTE